MANAWEKTDVRKQKFELRNSQKKNYSSSHKFSEHKTTSRNKYLSIYRKNHKTATSVSPQQINALFFDATGRVSSSTSEKIITELNDA